MFNATVCALTGDNQPELLLLDLDGTLIDSVPDLAKAVDSMLGILGMSLAGPERVARWVGDGADMLVRRALADGDEDAAKTMMQAQVTNARQYFDSAYMRCLHQATGAFPGVQEFLQATGKKVLITNKPRQFTEPLITSLGWDSHFEFLLCGDDLSERKPSPVPVLHACKELGISVENTLMVGDSRADIQAAKSAGVASVAVTYGYNHGEDIRGSAPDLVIDSLNQLLG
ncbi:MAG: phosphoglycolate phosphatase [Pseudomonadota bacterium]|jgi:phosphoglycolate phosphatase|nr:phosphoglycolate phosphatase [Pseudomonadota bacterium]MEC8525077.1 phosphoglycolate phosphatase [Pseudomonadota bacterium]